VVLVRGPHSFDDDAERQKDALPDLASDRASNRAGGTASMLVVQMGWQAADRLLRIGKRKPSSVQRIIDETLRPQSRALPDTVITVGVSIRPRTLQVPNVLATIPGTDLAHEVFILGAHYDHIGTHEPGRGHCPAPGEGETDTICNGADDNASGTAVVVEVARALAESGYRPRRSLVFACFAAEEIGLFGSKALADAPPDAPPFRGGKVAAMVNIDMVGRLSERGLYIGGVGSSSGWMPLLDDVGSHTLPVLYDRATSTRSDQASFYRHDVPVLFFFTGVHADYHAPGDEADGIHREALKHIADLVLELTRRAGDGAPLPFSPPASPAEGLVRSLPGDNPDTIEKRVP
jgi:hypothetical protein